MSRRMQAFYTTKLPCSGKRWKIHHVVRDRVQCHALVTKAMNVHILSISWATLQSVYLVSANHESFFGKRVWRQGLIMNTIIIGQNECVRNLKALVYFYSTSLNAPQTKKNNKTLAIVCTNPGRLNFVRWCLISVAPQYGICFMSSFWRLTFWGGF